MGKNMGRTGRGRHDWVYDGVQGSEEWQDQDECQRCG